MIGYDPAPQRDPPGNERWMLLGAFVLGLGLLVAIVVEDYEPVRLAPVFMLLSYFPLIALHEGGHALMARALGWKVEALVVGFGRDAMRFSIGETPVTVRMYPLGGWVLPTPTHLRRVRLASALIYLAGPLAELLVVAIIALVLGLDDLLTRTDHIPTIAAQAVCIAALLDVIVNLVPRRIDTEHGESATDGLGAIESYRRSEAEFARRVRTHHEEAMLDAVASRDVPRTLEACEDAFAALGDDPHLRSAMRSVLDRLAEEESLGDLSARALPRAIRERFGAGVSP